MSQSTSSSRRPLFRGFTRVLAAVLAGAAFVLGTQAAAAQARTATSDSRPAEVRIRELADRGRAERSQRRIDASIETFERARVLAEEASDFRAVVILDSEIQTSLDLAGRFERQLEVLRRLEARVEAMDDDPDFRATVLVHVHSDLSRALLRLSRTNEALEHAREAVDHLETTEDPAARHTACCALGASLMALGRPVEARSWLRRACEEGENLDPSDLRPIEAAIQLADCLDELGDSESAIAIAEDLVNRMESCGTYPAYLGSSIYSLRGRLQFYRNWNAAEQDLRRSLSRMRVPRDDESQVEFQRTTLELAHAIRNSGRPEESAAMERHALSALRARHGATNLTAIWAAQFLAASLWDIYDRTGDRAQLEEARRLYEEAAVLSKEVGSPKSSNVFAPLGVLLLDAFDDPRAAEPWLRAAVGEIESRSTGTLVLTESEGANLLRQRRLHKRYDPYEGLLRCLVRLDRAEEALDVLEHSRARSLADLLERSRFDSVQSALDRAREAGDEDAIERILRLPVELDAAMASIARARAATDSDESRARVRRGYAELQRLQSERAELTRSVMTAGRVAGMDEIRRTLEKDEVLCAYFLGRRSSFACLAEPAGGRVEWFPLVLEDGHPLTSDAVESKARAWLGSLSRGLGDVARGLAPPGSRPDRSTSTALEGHQLFRSLVPAALWQRLRERTVVHLVPHGPLNWLPFEALVVDPEGDDGAPVFWIDAGPAIAYQESGSALVWAQRRREEQKAAAIPELALIVADPAYGDAPGPPPPRSKGPVIARVRRGGPASHAGLLAGDALVSISGTTVGSVADVQRLLDENQDSRGAPLVVVRSGVELPLRLGPGDPGLELAPELPPELRRGVAGKRSEPLERLPGTAREAEAVRKALERRTAIPGAKGELVRVLMGGEATETLLTAWAPSATILHVAAHQIPDPSGFSDSGRLALTPPPYPTAEDDGFVDLDDFLIHWRGRLEHCGLAVLSSCWSRTGRLMRDEGFFGLPLGLRFAGCPSIVSSLWPVDDAATADLMSTFYASPKSSDSGSRLAAFQSARRALKRKWPDPYYWAAFVWSGAAH